VHADQDLANLAAGGNEAAQNAILARHVPALRAAVLAELSKLFDEHYAIDDCVQDTLIEAARSFSQFSYRGDGSFLAWLKQIARRQALDAARARAARKRGGGFGRIRVNADQATRLANSADLLHHDSETPTRAAAARERADALVVAIGRLRAEEQQVVELRYFDQRDWADVAAEMRCSVAAARSLSHRTLEKLKSILGEMSRYLSHD
jgi:RNA polymerase sigma-70 factor (ECF subfamily)